MVNSVHERAIDVINAMDQGSLSAVELLNDTYRRIECLNPALNAICTLVPFDLAVVEAERIDAARRRGESLPTLAGLPIAVKDLAETRGIRTTFGSKLFSEHVPEQDCLLAERLRAAGAIIIGKTNTPEFGAGSHTFNKVFGTTRNPYDTSLSAGGSSGGAASALAAGMLFIADGSDMGGSLRNPASFCNVVGMRPSLGRIPTWPQTKSRAKRMSVEGPMARNVEDCTLLLQALAGPDPRDPHSIDSALPNVGMHQTPEPGPLKLAWSPRPASLPVEPDVDSTLTATLTNFPRSDFIIEETSLEIFSNAMEIFKVMRAVAYAELLGTLHADNPGVFKSTLAGNIEEGLMVEPHQIIRAEEERQRTLLAIEALFQEFDYLLLPAAQVTPFPVEWEYPKSIDGMAMHSYIDWMSCCCITSPFDLPSVSIPAGFTDAGLPVGLQIVGKYGDDWGVLQAAYSMQEQAPHWQQHPPVWDT
jgi:amidase